MEKLQMNIEKRLGKAWLFAGLAVFLFVVLLAFLAAMPWLMEHASVDTVAKLAWAAVAAGFVFIGLCVAAIHNKLVSVRLTRRLVDNANHKK